MRVRCPRGDHEIDLPDDSLGARVRCPLCSYLFFVESEHDENPSEHIQAQSPPPIVTKPRETNDLGDRIYDGLPPLSVMIALRRQQGRDQEADDLAAKLEMTPDDWKALDAYESALRAAYGLRTTVIVASFAMLCHLPQLAFNVSSVPGRYDATIGAVLVLLIGCLSILWFGSFSLQKIQLSGPVGFSMLAVGAAGVAFVLAILVGIYQLNSVRYDNGPFWVVLALAFAVIALFDLVKTGVRLSRTLTLIEPSEITNRLTEALKYLE